MIIKKKIQPIKVPSLFDALIDDVATNQERYLHDRLIRGHTRRGLLLFKVILGVEEWVDVALAHGERFAHRALKCSCTDRSHNVQICKKYKHSAVITVVRTAAPRRRRRRR